MVRPIDEAQLDELLNKYPGFYFKENCTFSNPTILAFSGGLPCSGHGTCTPAGLCICDKGYRGIGDMFDLRGISCHNMILAEQIVWLIMSSVFVIVFIGYLRAIRLKTKALIKKTRGENGEKPSCGMLLYAGTRYFPYRVLIPFAFVGIPCFISLGVLRSFSDEYSIGNDLLATTLLLAGSIPGFLSQQESGLTQFNHIAKGSLLRSDQGRKAKRMFKLVVRCGELFYVFGKIPMIAYILLPDKPFNPIMYPMIILNNMIVALYLITYAFGGNKVYSKLEKLRKTMATTKIVEGRGGATMNTGNSQLGQTGKGNSKNNPSTQRLEEVLNLMRQTGDANRKAAIVGCSLYIIFSLPWMIGYQGFLYALMILVSAKPNLSLANSFAVGLKSYHSKGATGRTGLQDTRQYKDGTYASNYSDSNFMSGSVSSVHGAGEERTAKISVVDLLLQPGRPLSTRSTKSLIDSVV